MVGNMSPLSKLTKKQLITLVEALQRDTHRLSLYRTAVGEQLFLIIKQYREFSVKIDNLEEALRAFQNKGDKS